jgi:hypothetical protein
MLDVSNFSWRAGLPLLAAFFVGALLAISLGHRSGRSPTPDWPSDDWDIPQLVTFLNGKGLGLRLVSPRMDGLLLERDAFLTTTDREWSDFNVLPRVPERIQRWRGTLYCKLKKGENGGFDLGVNEGDCCLEAGPFVLFGDPALLARVRAAFNEPVTSEGSAAAPSALPVFPRKENAG